MPGENKTLAEFQEELKGLLKFDANTFLEAAERMSTYANEINKTFGQGRQRMQELMTTITDAIPGVNRLGGTIVDVSNTIKDVAEASRRNVIANAEDVEKLYAATKLLGTDAETLTNSFLDIGVGLEQIPKQLEDSLKYVRSIGGNSKQVFESVQRNMDMMNRYQFEGGVAGLTKMAAQASMLRFSMNETFKLADKVLTPEGAVETAAAFQRLGVAAGNLVDPFQLMNQSINDPSGLQNSLADVAKQFTYFDEKTKTFKINPQGVLTLRELEQQTGVNATEMSKLGLAAAELDQRLSAVGKAGLKIANEEDKQFLANIAKMGAGGEYEVRLRDEAGNEQTKKLSEITQQEFDKLIDEQKKGPTTLEDAARAQLTVTEIIRNDLSAIRNKFVGGVVSAGPITKGMEDARSFVERNTRALASDETMTTKDVRLQSEKFIDTVKGLLKDLQDPNKKAIDAFQSFFSQFGKQLDGMKEKVTSGVSDALTRAKNEKAAKTTSDQKSRVSDKVYALAEGKSAVEGNTTVSSTINPQTNNPTASNIAATTPNATVSASSSKITVDGGLTIKLDLPANFAQLNTEAQNKILDEVFNSQKFQQMLVNSSAPKSPTKQPVSTGYS